MPLDEVYPLPEHPVLAQWAQSLNAAGYWAQITDADGSIMFVSDELRRSHSGLRGLAPEPIGVHAFSTEAYDLCREHHVTYSEEQGRAWIEQSLGFLYSVHGGDRAAVRASIDPAFADVVDANPDPGFTAPESVQALDRQWGIDLASWSTTLPIHDADGTLLGIAGIGKPAAGMSILGLMGGGDLRHMERTQALVTADRRPAAILFADLEASSVLSRRMSTSEYFSLARRLVRAADEAVVDAGGVVGRHLGDGVTAFFLPESLGSESAAARAAVEASRELRRSVGAIGERIGLEPDDVIVRFGLHWGATLYVGLFKTVARSEVTAMGDEVNEAARIEACATGGLTLASKPLIERLTRADLAALGLEQVHYTPLGELTTATEKARRDAPNLSVCAIT